MVEEEFPLLLSTPALFCKTFRPHIGASVASSHLESRPPHATRWFRSGRRQLLSWVFRSLRLSRGQTSQQVISTYHSPSCSLMTTSLQRLEPRASGFLFQPLGVSLERAPAFLIFHTRSIPYLLRIKPIADYFFISRTVQIHI